MFGDRYIDADGDSLELRHVRLETAGDRAHYGAGELVQVEIQAGFDPHLVGPVSVVLGRRAALALAESLRRAAEGLEGPAGPNTSAHVPDPANPGPAALERMMANVNARLAARGGSRADGPMLGAE